MTNAEWARGGSEYHRVHEKFAKRAVYNFGAGPAMLPREVLQRARDELLDWRGTGVSVMELSHRSDEYMAIAERTECDLRALLDIPSSYKVLFLQGGASSQFAIFSSTQPHAKTIPEYGSDATNTETVVLVPRTGSKIAIFVPAQSTCIVCPGTCAIRIVSSLTSTYSPTIWQNR